MAIKFYFPDSFKYHWQWYKHFFSLSYLRYFGTWFAVAPVIAAISENAERSNKFCIDQNCTEYSFYLPFSWWLLWAGSLFFIISFGLYQYFCPKFIKDYSSYADYEAARHSPRWAAWESLYLINDAKKSQCAYDLDKFVRRLVDKRLAEKTDERIAEPYVEVSETQSLLNFSHNGISYRMGMPKFKAHEDHIAEIDDVATYELVWEVFGRRAASYTGVRKSIAILITLAWLTVVISILQNIWTTANLLFWQIGSV
jgi:hypothetical protein